MSLPQPITNLAPKGNTAPSDNETKKSTIEHLVFDFVSFLCSRSETCVKAKIIRCVAHLN